MQKDGSLGPMADINDIKDSAGTLKTVLRLLTVLRERAESLLLAP